MGSPDRPYWTPLRITFWGSAAVLVALWFGPAFVGVLRPADGVFSDYSQEWLSARNYWTGTPVYADQAEALTRHTGLVLERAEDILPWNAHPPASVLLAIPLGRLSYRDSLLAWNLLTLPLFFLSLWLIVRELGLSLSPWSLLPALVLVLLFNPLYIQLAQGQLNPPILLLIVLAWVGDRRGRPGWAGVALGLATGLKLYPAFLFAYFLFAGRWRALATGGAAVLVVNAVALAVLGANEFRTYAVNVVPSLFDYQSSWRNVSLTGFWVRAFNPHPNEKIVPLVVSPTAAAVLVAVSRVLVAGCVARAALRAHSTVARDRAFAAAIVGVVLVSPIAWTHYFVLLALPVALLWARAPRGPLRFAMWPVLGLFWLPESAFALLFLERDQAVALVNTRHEPLDPVTNLVALSVFTYALVALFGLVLALPRNEGPSPASAPAP